MKNGAAAAPPRFVQRIAAILLTKTFRHAKLAAGTDTTRRRDAGCTGT
jgi:hypothetical protein